MARQYPSLYYCVSLCSRWVILAECVLIIRTLFLSAQSTSHSSVQSLLQQVNIHILIAGELIMTDLYLRRLYTCVSVTKQRDIEDMAMKSLWAMTPKYIDPAIFRQQSSFPMLFLFYSFHLYPTILPSGDPKQLTLLPSQFHPSTSLRQIKLRVYDWPEFTHQASMAEWECKFCFQRCQTGTLTTTPCWVFIERPRQFIQIFKCFCLLVSVSRKSEHGSILRFLDPRSNLKV